MPKVVLNLNNTQIERIVESLPLAEKIRLVRILEKETLSQHWNEILNDIDKRLKKFPISEKEIEEEIKDYRKEKHAKSRS